MAFDSKAPQNSTECPNACWSPDGKQLEVYFGMFATPDHIIDNMNRMLCPVSPVDFLELSTRYTGKHYAHL